MKITKKICPMMDESCVEGNCIVGGFCKGDKTKEELLQWFDKQEKFAEKTLMRRSQEGLCWTCGGKNLVEINWKDGGKGFPRLICKDCAHDQPTLQEMVRNEEESLRLLQGE